MTISRQTLIDTLRAAGISTFGWVLLDNEYEPVSVAKVQEIADACLDSLPAELVTVRQIGGGKSIRVPLWVVEAGDCEDHSFVLFAWCIIGNWLRAVREKVKRGGMACGPILYTAEPRAENGYRAGRHSILWHLDFNGQVCFYEFGDNAPTMLTLNEVNSITQGFAA